MAVSTWISKGQPAPPYLGSGGGGGGELGFQRGDALHRFGGGDV
jgi:hypothetical protein